MPRHTVPLAFTALAVLAAPCPAGEKPAAKPTDSLRAVPFQAVRVQDGFWTPRIERNRTVTLEANLRQCQVTGCIDNFAVAGKLKQGKHRGLLFYDSDLYKVIEGIGYTLAQRPDPDLEKRCDAIIDLIAAAQQPDGYLNTYYTLVKPAERWKNIQHGHELYCAGHLMEAAVAYHQATGKRKLLDVARKLADHIIATFGPGRRIDTSGHEEIELALVKLYRATGDKRYLDQARFFLDVRGRADKRKLFGEYAQDHKPVRQQRNVTGHAVRAMYLYCGMADVAAVTGDRELVTALESIWRDVVERKMYVTGGIGPSAHNEGFTVPYDLPNDSAYAETCAAVGMALWNHRMFLMSGGDGKYADVLERVAYNGLLSGVSLAGDRFFYVNPLGSKGKHHRQTWFECSCCPGNVVRYLAGMGDRVYAHSRDGIWTVLYIGGTATVPLAEGKVKLGQQTRYPWDGEVTITVDPEKKFAFTLHLRVPGWCKAAPLIEVNGKRVEKLTPSKGYVALARTWAPGDKVRLVLPMPVERVLADPRVKADVGRVALQRGPIVYCLEGVDNGGHPRGFVLRPEAKLTAEFVKDLLGGVVAVRGDALAVSFDGKAPGEKGGYYARYTTFQAIPYSLWDNRKPGEMVVWLPERPELAEAPGEQGVLSNGVRVRASHVYRGDTLTALNDGMLPKSSKDQNIPRMTWWDRRGTTEWVSYQFPEPRKLGRAAVYWFDDTGKGGCRVPQSWRLLWRDGSEWKEVKLTGGSAYGTAPDRLNEVTFEPVTARVLKLEMRLRPEFSGGILEWEVGAPK